AGIFTYFTDFPDPELGKAVSEGRKKEYESFLGEGFIDPQSPEAFESSKLDWQELEKPAHQEMLKFHRDLIALRKAHRCLSNCRKDLTTVDFDDRQRWISIERRDAGGERAIIVCNLDDKQTIIPLGEAGPMRLALYSGDAGVPAPPARIASVHRSVTLNEAGVAVYLSDG
ncbi:MAG TPA: DUF3459 domain-containing protein, partial [Candidatus Binataceae bacterium]|nr:DUF3459 domain-containing protein [Candidatus Binataceae bacterium]